MTVPQSRLALQLRDFIISNHVYVDDINEETKAQIHRAAEEAEENVPVGVTKRKGKPRRSIAPQFPVEWSSSREAFQRAVYKFEAGLNTLGSGKPCAAGPSRTTPVPSIHPIPITRNMPTAPSPSIPRSENLLRNIPPNFNDFDMLIIPREVTSLFDRIDKLDEHNWATWKYHIKDNMEMCNLWDIVTGEEQRPDSYYVEEARQWTRRDKIARILIKNLLNSKDYVQVQHIEHAAGIWKTLMGLHQSTGAQGKVDLIWKFWNLRCNEGESVREHIGSIRAAHAELAELGIIIENYLLAIVLSKSLPPSYDIYVSTIFASIRDLDEADPNYFAQKLFEEEQRRQNQSADVNTISRSYCTNCKKPGHIKENCYAKGGGKEGQGPRQIAWRKKEEFKKRQKDKEAEESALEQSAQAVESDVFMASFIKKSGTSITESIHYTSSSCVQNSWIADSGASTHIANQREMFSDYQPSTGILNVAGGMTTKVEGTGTVTMRGLVDEKQKEFKLTNVLYVPSTRHCLLSGPRLDQSGGRAIYEKGKCQFWNARGEILTTGALDGNLYRINAKAIMCHTPVINMINKTTISWHDAHRRLGHLSLSSLKLIFSKGLIDGIQIDKNEVLPTALDCESCILAKAHRAPFSNQVERHTKKVWRINAY